MAILKFESTEEKKRFDDVFTSSKCEDKKAKKLKLKPAFLSIIQFLIKILNFR